MGARKQASRRELATVIVRLSNLRAVTRPTMHFMTIKSVEQQAAVSLHKTRDLLVRQRTMLVNALRRRLAEFDIIAQSG